MRSTRGPTTRSYAASAGGLDGAALPRLRAGVAEAGRRRRPLWRAAPSRRHVLPRAGRPGVGRPPHRGPGALATLSPIARGSLTSSGYSRSPGGHRPRPAPGLPLDEGRAGARHRGRSPAIQHHHAHLAACLAEYGVTAKAVGAIFDGAGYGADGTVWAGKCSSAASAASGGRRLWPVGMPGGAGGGRSRGGWPRRGWPRRPGDPPEPEARRGVGDRGLGGGEGGSTGCCGGRAVADDVEHRSSVRRGGRAMRCAARVSFEGQAAIELEALAWTAGQLRRHKRPINMRSSFDGTVLDPRDAVRAISRTTSNGALSPRAIVAARFHAGVAAATVDAVTAIASARGLETAVLSWRRVPEPVVAGGRCVADLATAGLHVLVPAPIATQRRRHFVRAGRDRRGSVESVPVLRRPSPRTRRTARRSGSVQTARSDRTGHGARPGSGRGSRGSSTVTRPHPLAVQELAVLAPNPTRTYRPGPCPRWTWRIRPAARAPRGCGRPTPGPAPAAAPAPPRTIGPSAANSAWMTSRRAVESVGRAAQHVDRLAESAHASADASGATVIGPAISRPAAGVCGSRLRRLEAAAPALLDVPEAPDRRARSPRSRRTSRRSVTRAR